jgi:hypothetical protein
MKPVIVLLFALPLAAQWIFPSGNSGGALTVTSVNTQTGAVSLLDLNSSGQVAATHLTSALPVNQGGTGAALTASNGALPYSTATAFALGSVGTAKQLMLSGGAGAYAWIDYPDFHYFPAADCVNAVAGSAWDTAATPAAACRAGTNNKGAFLGPWGASDVGDISIGLPLDWDSATNPSVSLQLASTDATNGHTVIMQLATACYKGDGSTTDDVAFNAAQSFATVTLNGTASRQWKTTLSNITMTGCTAGGILKLRVSRTTDTATNVEVYGLGLTIPRLLTVQAN